MCVCVVCARACACAFGVSSFCHSRECVCELRIVNSEIVFVLCIIC